MHIFLIYKDKAFHEAESFFYKVSFFLDTTKIIIEPSQYYRQKS